MATNGNDTIVGTSGNDNINALGGDDVVDGRTGNDTLNGGSGNDTVLGWTGNDTLNGSDGHDTVLGWTGDDTLYGGTGNDTLTGEAGTDYLDGWIGDDLLIGGDGNDSLRGWTGNDELYGVAGNDTLNGGSGNDLLDGGAGSDTASYATALASVRVSLFLGEAQNTGGAGIDTLLNIENLTGSNFNDTLALDDIDDRTLNGGAGDDELLSFRSINSTLNGGAGNDFLFADENAGGTLNGGSGNDHLLGEDGVYTLNGGSGNDNLEIVRPSDSSTLNGGDGADTLFLQGQGIVTLTCDYNAVSDSPAGAGRDVITGFAGQGSAIGDRIDLRDIDANTLVSGNQKFSYIGGAAYTGTAGELRYAGGILRGDTNGDAASDFHIALVGAPMLFVDSTAAGTDIVL